MAGLNAKFLVTIIYSSVFFKISNALQWIVLSDLGHEMVTENFTEKSNREELLRQLAKKNVDELATHLWAELLSMGMGHDFYGLSCTGKEGVNQDHHVVAITVMNLSQKLHIMHRVFNCMEYGATKGAEYVNRTGDIGGAMAVVYEEIENLMKNDTDLYAEYLEAKRETSKRPKIADHVVHYPLIPTTEREAKKIFVRWINNPAMKITSANGFFEGQARLDLAVSQQAFTLVSAILGLAYDANKRNAVQIMYEDALVETSRSLSDMSPEDVDNERQGDVFMRNTVYPLLENLQTKFEANPSLNADLMAMQEKVRSCTI